MSDVYSLLNIQNGLFQDFSLLANRVADHQTEKVVNRNMSKLKQIEEVMLVDKGLEIDQPSIDKVIRKVIRMASFGNTSKDNWTLRELRIVSYYLMKLHDKSTNYMFALDLLDKNWHNMFFNGLAFYLMNSWHNIVSEYREKASLLLVKKLTEYQGNNRRYLLWKNHANLFEINGPIRMAAMIAALKKSIKDAPTLLGFKKSFIKQSYYSDVIIRYISNNHITERSKIERLFEVHDLDRTKKLIFAYLIEQKNQNGDDVQRTLLCHFANAHLGDITLASSWAPFVGATDSDKEKLERARHLVNMWFAQQIIESFFEICVQDKERKTFWLKYVQHVSGFKIVGSTAIKRLLQNDSKISNMFTRHFIETNSYKSQTSALLLFIKDKMIVEFSDTGALYVYNLMHPMAKTVTGAHHRIASTNDLKIPEMNVLVETDRWGDYSIYNEEGKLHHRGNWQKRLNGWMKKKILPPSDTSLLSNNGQHDEVSKSESLPAKINTETVHEPPHQHPALIIPIEKPTTQNNAPNESQTAKHTLSSTYTWETTKYSSSHNPPFSKSFTTEKATQPIPSHNTPFCQSNPLRDGIRIIANIKGYFLSLSNPTRLILIRGFEQEESPYGEIHIKESNMSGWYEIVHIHEDKTTHSIGFITIYKNGVLFKDPLSLNTRVMCYM